MSLEIGDWAQSPIPNPQSPIPNPHKNIQIIFGIFILIKYFFILIIILNLKLILNSNEFNKQKRKYKGINNKIS